MEGWPELVERRPRSGVTPVPPKPSNRRLRWALTGAAAALAVSGALALGLNTFDGVLTSQPVAQAHGLDHRELAEVLG